MAFLMVKMTSHVIAFESPVPKIYSALPLPLNDLNDVLAIMFTGPASLCQDQYKHLLPLLVCRSHIACTLSWLILNSPDYEDVKINCEILEEYLEEVPPVQVIYKESDTNRIVEAKSIFNMHTKKGTDSGDCPFIVHMLTRKQHNSKLPNALKVIAMKYWNQGGKVLRVSQSPGLKSIYDNLGLYPQMFSWLFPYGLGGGLGHQSCLRTNTSDTF